jgi:hypothetical protein
MAIRNGIRNILKFEVLVQPKNNNRMYRKIQSAIVFNLQYRLHQMLAEKKKYLFLAP